MYLKVLYFLSNTDDDAGVQALDDIVANICDKPVLTAFADVAKVSRKKEILDTEISAMMLMTWLVAFFCLI